MGTSANRSISKEFPNNLNTRSRIPFAKIWGSVMTKIRLSFLAVNSSGSLANAPNPTRDGEGGNPYKLGHDFHLSPLFASTVCHKSIQRFKGYAPPPIILDKFALKNTAA